VIDKPTRLSGNTSTLLDPIILSDTLNCNYSDVLRIPRHISDHDAAIASLEMPVPSHGHYGFHSFPVVD
jgi:hypothetical protein